jgi:hypothetical protein
MSSALVELLALVLMLPPGLTGKIVALVLLLPPALILVRLVWRVRKGRTPFLEALLSPGIVASVALTCIGYAAIDYAIGFFSDFNMFDPDQMCASRAGFYSGRPGPSDKSWLGITDELFPLHHTFRWADGTIYELVPGWVNPLFYTLLAMAWAALLARPLATLFSPRPA